MRIKKEIYKLKEIPPLSIIAQKILDAVSDDDIDLLRLSSTLEQSPQITARLIGLANSAYFGHAGKVLTLSDAVIRVLGLPTAKGLAMAFALGDAFRTTDCPAFRHERYWQTALMTAFLAQRFSPLVRSEDTPGEAVCYTGGLLAQLGLLALVHQFPQEMNRALDNRDPTAMLNLAERIRSTLGTDHHEAGAWLAEKWRLPPLLVTIIRHHHQTEYRDDHWPAVLLIGLCNRYAEQLGQDAGDAPPSDDISLSILGIAGTARQGVIDAALKRREALSDIAHILTMV